MSPEEREHLLDLHRVAVTAMAAAASGNGKWIDAFAADDIFVAALMGRVTA